MKSTGGISEPMILKIYEPELSELTSRSIFSDSTKSIRAALPVRSEIKNCSPMFLMLPRTYSRPLTGLGKIDNDPSSTFSLIPVAEPGCMMTSVSPAISMIPVLVEPVKLPATDMLTGPLAFPEEFVDNHELPETTTALQLHPALVFKLAMEKNVPGWLLVSAKVLLERAYTQDTPGCMTVMVCPATSIVPTLAELPLFWTVVMEIDPLPLPLEEVDSQLLPLVTTDVHVQPLFVKTDAILL